ncbi:YybH family protein [Agromyces aurantiacus]|uniref:YybH family protein n=1 Tax=Agromyces aurantiacus TaxID=165814 RepID=A0ABV9R9W3_9MICO|nr:nuclear transport factor 2 family protein [Agromyces aurantiacus]MBM7503784.1 ketosteroid isomerase-like protein [Agromyces aurantiacus]
MNEREEFLEWVHGPLVAAERAMFDGDDGPRRAVWAQADPVSVFGAWRNAVGRPALVEAFDELAMSFSHCTAYALDLISFDVVGDMAYTVGYERVTTSVNGAPRSVTIRSTQVYRRDDGEWRVVHRHADTIS